MDAVIQANPGLNRVRLVRQILAEWARREVHRATLILRVTRSEGVPPPPEWPTSGFGVEP
jgi:hypothetical protein